MLVWIVGSLLVIGSAVVLAVVSPVVVRFHYVRRQGTDRFTVDFRGFWGTLRRTWVLPGHDALGTAVETAMDTARRLDERRNGQTVGDREGDGPAIGRATGPWQTYLESGRRLAGLWKTHGEMRRAIRRFFQNVTIRTWRTRVRVGTGEAASTGMLVGVFWSFFYAAAAMLGSRVRLCRPEVRVTPVFRDRTLEVEIEGIAHFRAGQAIGAGVAMAIVLWKEGLLWRSTPFKI